MCSLCDHGYDNYDENTKESLEQKLAEIKDRIRELEIELLETRVEYKKAKQELKEL